LVISVIPSPFSKTVLTACATGVAAIALAAPAPARAGNVTLWACHGPGGQPLGTGPLIENSSGDGVATGYGSACSVQIGSLADGGLAAGFGRPDPLGGSAAGWRVEVPAGTTLTSVGLDRATAGFGAEPQSSDRQLYEASTSAGVLESSSLADATDVARSGAVMFPASPAEDVTFGVTCGAPLGGRCAAPSSGTVGVQVSSIALGVSDDGPPAVAVGGISDPAGDPLPVAITATDPGLGLESATAGLDGQAGARTQLGGPNCAPLAGGPAGINLELDADCPEFVNNVPLTLRTAGVGDGSHSLTVTVTDAAGNTTTVQQQVTVRNHVVVPGSSVILSVGSGGQLPGTSSSQSGGVGSGPGPTSAVCAAPQLSAVLASTPLGISPGGRAVLWAGTRYLFTGRLTCVRNNHRVGAPTNTVVDIRSVIGRRIVPRTEVAVYAHGEFRVLLHPRTTRIIEFRVGAPSVRRQVSIAVVVTQHRGSR
jgi:hypothetical protein